MTLRPILENPLRNYAMFSGRAGRAEFWLFVLTFIVVTQLAWLLGFGAMKIAGFDQGDDDRGSYSLMEKSEQDSDLSDNGDKVRSDNMTTKDRADRAIPLAPDSQDRSSDRQDRHHDDMLNFMIHRHGKDGYHLHGTIHDDHMSPHGHDDLDNELYHEQFVYRDHAGAGRIHMSFHDNRAERGGDILWAISIAALILPMLAVGARRLHDSNHSGWWQLLALIPVAGWLVLTVFFLLPGEESDNRFGPPSAL